VSSTDTPHRQGSGNTLRLTDLPPGRVAEVVAVDPACQAAKRLLDLGFTPGTKIRVVRRAPLGDPMVYELRGMRLCLRRSEADWVRVSLE
jgi:ferrous iron transport protein A